MRISDWSSDVCSADLFADFKDPNGVYAIRELVKAGQNGSHYVDYSFAVPGSNALVPKVGYAEYLPKWNLVFGTSLNLDDVERDVGEARAAFQARIDSLTLLMLDRKCVGKGRGVSVSVDCGGGRSIKTKIKYRKTG